MKITSIEIQNFKAFKEVQSFPIESKNVLVFGNNGSGKSSLYYALHVFLQSSIKEEKDRRKYFVFDGKESLLNIYAKKGFPSYIRIATDNRSTYEFSPTPKAGNILNVDNSIKLSNESSDFMNYRLLSAFSNFRNSQDADLFPVFYTEFFPYWEYSTSKTFQEQYDEIFAEIKALEKKRVKPLAGGKEYQLRKTSKDYRDFEKKIETFSTNFKDKIFSYVEGINDLMRDFFLKDDKIKLLFREEDFVPIAFEVGMKWRLMPPKVLLRIEKDGKPIPKPHIFLNEARLTGIALSTRFAVFAQRYKGKTETIDDFKILVLDDLLLSLDMSKRMEVVNYILKNEDFKKYQLFILTHDKGFYTILQNNLIKKDSEWKCFEFYENSSNPSVYKNPIVIESIDSLKKAEDLLKGDPTAVTPVPPKYDECALYLRKKAEELIRVFYDPTLENLSRFEVLEKLANSLKGIEKEYYGRVRGAITSLFEDDLLLTKENITRLKDDPYINDILSREEVLNTNHLKFKILTVLEEFSKHRDKINSVRKDLLQKCKGVDELRDRILNHGAHPTAEPLFGEELDAGVDTIEKFEVELKAMIEWFKTLESDILKLKETKTV